MKFVDKLDFEPDEPPMTEPDPADFFTPQESYPRPNSTTKAVYGKLGIYSPAGLLLVEFRELEFEFDPVKGIHRAYNLSGTMEASGKADYFLLTLFLPKEVTVRGSVAERGDPSGLRLGTRHLTTGSQIKISFFEVSGLQGE